MLAEVVAAILVLAPTKVADAAVKYAGSIHHQAKAQKADPLLIVALIHTETGGRWDNTLVSKSNDYGLMQVHVSRTTHADYLGRETELFDPETNILVGVQMLSYWKKYHKRCKGKHHWWAHYKWGREVKDDAYGNRVARVYARVKRISYLAQEGQVDHSIGRARRLWQGHASCSPGRITIPIDYHFVPKILGAVRCGYSGALEGRSDVLSEGQGDRGIVSLTRRRRGIPGPNDDGQVRCGV